MSTADSTQVPSPSAQPTKRWLWFSCWMALSLILFIKPISSLVRFSLSQNDASHLVLIPFISAALLYMERDKVFAELSTDTSLGGAFLLLCGFVDLASYSSKAAPTFGWQLSGWILALTAFWLSGFAFFFGRKALRAAYFPSLFLLLMVPIPGFLLDRIILLLQEGSAWITGVLFDMTGVPVLREGLVFHLPKVSIEVAKECSGIRSSMALLILALLVAHFCLKSFWNRLLFVICGLFMMIVKNGIRIATLTLLAIYVNPDFLFGRLHHQGGVVFFVLALLLLLPLLFFLQRLEARKGVAAPGLS